VRIADFVVRALDAVCTETIVAANDPAAAAWFPHHRIVADAVPGRGALGALETALNAATAPTVVVCAWDMPFVTAAILDALATAVEAGASCCIPMHADGQLEPLCAAYDSSAARVVTMLRAGGARAAHELVTAIGGARWQIQADGPGRDQSRMFQNINTHDDLAQAVEWYTFVQGHS